MPVNALQFERQIGSGELAPVYLLAGSEDLLRIEAADAVRAAAKTQGFSEREVFEVDRQFDWNTLEAAFAAMSLFASRRLLDVRLPTGKPGKEGAAVIEAFCANPAPDLSLLITCNEWSRQHEAAWSRAVDKAGVLFQIQPMKPGDLPGWIARRLQSRGVQADTAAVRELADRVEGNLLAAAQEVDKLALIAGSERLDAARMQDLVADSARFDVFRMVDVAVGGDAARALRMLRSLRAEGEAVVPLMNVVAGLAQVVAHASAVAAQGGNVANVWQQGRVWDSKQQAYRRLMQRLGPRGCEQLLASCAELDLASKGRSDEDPWRLYERVLVAIADPRGLALLAEG